MLGDADAAYTSLGKAVMLGVMSSPLLLLRNGQSVSPGFAICASTYSFCLGIVRYARL